jgi:hypothetical protein
MSVFIIFYTANLKLLPSQFEFASSPSNLGSLLILIDYINSCGQSDQLVVKSNIAKNSEVKPSEKREAKLRVKMS